LAKIRDRWPVEAFYITENGAAFADLIEESGNIRDGERIDYLRSHLAACKTAIDAGIPIKGYYVWSLIDNFEWAHGYSKRFGIVHVDFDSGERSLKDSYRFYQTVIDKNII
jgi:beta-glucosidase